jgi:hypothetical protein
MAIRYRRRWTLLGRKSPGRKLLVVNRGDIARS